MQFALRLSCPRLRAALPPCFTQRAPATGCTSHALHSNALRWTSRKICAALCVPPAGGPTPMTCGCKLRVPHGGLRRLPGCPPLQLCATAWRIMPSAPSRPMMHVSPCRQPTSWRCAAVASQLSAPTMAASTLWSSQTGTCNGRPSPCVGTPVSWPGACPGSAHAAHAVSTGKRRACRPMRACRVPTAGAQGPGSLTSRPPPVTSSAPAGGDHSRGAQGPVRPPPLLLHALKTSIARRTWPATGRPTLAHELLAFRAAPARGL